MISGTFFFFILFNLFVYLILTFTYLLVFFYIKCPTFLSKNCYEIYLIIAFLLLCLECLRFFKCCFIIIIINFLKLFGKIIIIFIKLVYIFLLKHFSVTFLPQSLSCHWFYDILRFEFQHKSYQFKNFGIKRR